jgi:hypothetical protein
MSIPMSRGRGGPSLAGQRHTKCPFPDGFSLRESGFIPALFRFIAPPANETEPARKSWAIPGSGSTDDKKAKCLLIDGLAKTVRLAGPRRAG